MSFLSFVGLHVEYTTEESRSYVQLAQSTQPGQTGTSCLGRYFAGGEETKVRKKVTNQDCTRCQIWTIEKRLELNPPQYSYVSTASYASYELLLMRTL